MKRILKNSLEQFKKERMLLLTIELINFNQLSILHKTLHKWSYKTNYKCVLENTCSVSSFTVVHQRCSGIVFFFFI